MGMLTLVFIVAIAIAVVTFLQKEKPSDLVKSRLAMVRGTGLFGLVLGMLGQFIGLFSAFEVISQGVDVSPAMMAGGLKVSMIAPIYGMIIFLISYLMTFVLRLIIKPE